MKKRFVSDDLPAADTTSRTERHAFFGLETGVQLQVVDVAIQLTCRGSNPRGGGPLLECLKAFEAEELAELVHGADAPSPGLLYTQDLDDAEACGRPAGAVSPCHLLSRVLEDLRKVIVAEGSVRLALETGKWIRA